MDKYAIKSKKFPKENQKNKVLKVEELELPFSFDVEVDTETLKHPKPVKRVIICISIPSNILSCFKCLFHICKPEKILQ